MTISIKRIISLTATSLFQPFSPTPPTSFIFYLPRGPIPFSSSAIPPEPTDLRPLAESASAVVARVNYRLGGGPREKYPLPIHDVAAAWNWLFGLRMTQRPGAPPGPRHLPPIGVCGEFVGGSLAAMLALTECHAKSMPGITAAYLGNPIADWTMMGKRRDNSSADGNKTYKDLVDLAKGRRSKSAKTVPAWEKFAHASELSSTQMAPLRAKLFADSSYWFDSFASPLLFFRTPAEHEPDPDAQEDETFAAVLQTVTEEDDSRTSPSSGTDSTEQKDRKLRISHRRWPPLRSGLVLPDMHMTLGVESPVRDMGDVLAKCANRSVFMYELEKAIELHEVSRAMVEDRPGAGFWDGEELVRIGQWFKAVFRYK